MTKQRTTPPDAKEIVDALRKEGKPLDKKQLSRIFGLHHTANTQLRLTLHDLAERGVLVQEHRKYSLPGTLPEVADILIIGITIDGDIEAKPVQWDESTQGKPPRIEIVPTDKGAANLKPGDRVLATLRPQPDGSYSAKAKYHIDTRKLEIVGLLDTKGQFPHVRTLQKKEKDQQVFGIAGDMNGARHGQIVACEISGRRNRDGSGGKVKILEVLGEKHDPRIISLLSMHERGLRPHFPKAVEDATKGMDVPQAGGKREDLRDIPLVTIDGPDARDFDDAVYAEKTENGYHLIVAIADVAWYVRSGATLDREAFKRGNSTYFPDRVVPMLPEALSNGLCSLVPHENRACLAVHMWIDESGHLQQHKFVRGLMKSAARLTYEQVQAARDGMTDDVTGPLMEPVIAPLYDAYKVLWAAREKRGALDLDLPERKIVFDADGRMAGVEPRVRLDSHKLIEEFMILANVAAATALENAKAPCVYRIHDTPSPEKIASASEFIATFGLSLPKGQSIRPSMLNEVLHKAKDMPYSHLVSEVILRSQAQAHYNPENIGHFGLALRKYAHFTSPIRRYADLLVHRALLSHVIRDEGGLADFEVARLHEICEHISATERTSMEAERTAVDRFVAAYLADRTGATFQGRIRSVTRFGLFVELAGTGADGFIPIRTLPEDFYDHDDAKHALIGQRTRRIYQMGADVSVALNGADPLTGNMLLKMLGDEDAVIPGFSFGQNSKKKLGGRTGNPGPVTPKTPNGPG